MEAGPLVVEEVGVCVELGAAGAAADGRLQVLPLDVQHQRLPVTAGPTAAGGRADVPLGVRPADRGLLTDRSGSLLTDETQR